MLLHIMPLVALVPALFFQGHNPPWFAVSIIALLIWVGGLISRQLPEIQIPKGGLPLVLILLCVWLSATLFWTVSLCITDYNLWRLSALPLCFFAVQWVPEAHVFWRRLRWIALSLLVVLGSYAAFQHLYLDADAAATFANRNNFATLLHLLGFILLAGVLRRKDVNTEIFSDKGRICSIALLLFAVGFVEGIIYSRGAFIGVIAAVGVLALSRLRLRYALKPLFWGASTYVLGVIFSTLSWFQPLGKSMLSLSDPTTAGSSRWIIWQSALEMWQAAPWYGVGFGTFWLHYPQWRAPQEGSAGYFVHNDYLQLLVEGGWPALILALLVIIVSASMWWRSIQYGAGSAADKMELSVLFAGLIAAAVHSVFTFNLYILPLLIPGGLMWGRFHQIYCSLNSVAPYRLRIPLKLSFARTLLWLLLLFPLVHLGAVGWTEHHRNKIAEADPDTPLEEIDKSLVQMRHLWPWQDFYWFQHADLYRESLLILAEQSGDSTHNQEQKSQQRQKLFDIAWGYLDQAQELNPLRPQIYACRALLLYQNPDLAPMSDPLQAARANWERALQINPRLYKARVDLAISYLKENHIEQARELLEAGLRQHHRKTPPMLPFYRGLAALRSHYGDEEGAAELQEVIDEIRETYSEEDEEKAESGIEIPEFAS